MRPMVFKRVHQGRWILTILIVLVLITGCGTINQQPFADFTSSLQELRKGSEEALKVTVRPSHIAKDFHMQ